MKIVNCLLTVLLTISVVSFSGKSKRPVLYLIGDSTVRNGDGSGRNGQWGWGTLLHHFVDTGKLAIRNHAIGGRSSRTFITEGRWAKVLESIKPGDYLLIQFGHNDAGPLDDTARARGTIRGIGPDSLRVYNPIRKVEEIVYSYGHYLRRYVREARAAGALPIICSPIPRNDWKEGKVIRSDSSYGRWAAEIAREEGTGFIHLNHLVAEAYEQLGADKVKAFFPADHTHTDSAGADLNARIVARGLQLQPKAKRLKKAIVI
jgi:lysophospholipase L1-like esterase